MIDVVSSSTFISILDIEAQIKDLQNRKRGLPKDGISSNPTETPKRIGLGESGYFDREIYDSKSKFDGYVTSIAPNEEPDVSVRITEFFEIGNSFLSKQKFCF